MADVKDQFANYAIIEVLESAANTLTFKKLETGISLNEKVAWIIHRIEYIIDGLDGTLFNAALDVLTFGLSLSNAFSAPTVAENTIIDYNRSIRVDIGTAASGYFQLQPFVKDFASLPMGGTIVPPTPLYLFVKGTGLTAAAKITARLHYTLRTLKVEDYWELVEARRVLSS
jgi:hypothetical protein